jgi:hypothetical protein
MYTENEIVLSGYLNPSNMTTFCALMSGYLTGSGYTIALQLSNYTLQHNITVNKTTLEPVMQSVDSNPSELMNMEETVSAPTSTEYLYSTALQVMKKKKKRKRRNVCVMKQTILTTTFY